jgi:hypothetical protein
MTVHGIGPIIPPRTLAVHQPASTPVRSAEPQAPATEVARPNGVNAELWSVLTAEERSFFSQLTSLGSLTYGPRPSPGVSAPVGQRIDVRA